MENKTEKEFALKAFSQIKNEIKKTCIRIELTDNKPTIFESKAGGVGYIPHEDGFPTDSKGNQLRLLAQIDCSKINLDEFPKQGLLQFWIMNDDLCGADFDNNTKQDTFRIVYHESVDTTVTEDEIKSKIVPNEYEQDGEEDFMPVNGEYGLTFAPSENVMTVFDYRFDKEFAKRYNALDTDKDIEDTYDPEYNVDEFLEYSDAAFAHKIGGYPAFTQEDPRKCLSEEEAANYDFLLLQLESDFSDGVGRILWGDAGICNFFINSEKLKALDFSDVIYNWDCY